MTGKENMSVREMVSRQPGEEFDPSYQSAYKKTMAALDRAFILTAEELQKTPPAFLLHLWGCGRGKAVWWLNRRLKARLGRGFDKQESFLDEDMGYYERVTATRKARADSLEDFQEWQPGLLESEKQYAVDRLAARQAEEERMRQDALKEGHREEAEKAAQRKLAEDEARLKAAEEAQTWPHKPFARITYREWLVGRLVTGCALQPPMVLARIVHSADTLIQLMREATPVNVSDVTTQDIDTIQDWYSLSMRAKKGIRRLKVCTLQDLASRHTSELLSLVGFGYTSLNELKHLLEKHQLKFPD